MINKRYSVIARSVATKQSILLLLICCGLMACKQKKPFPEETHLEFVSLEKINNGTQIDGDAVLKLHFTDGDGNIGVDERENNDPDYRNFFVVYYAKRNGEFVAFPQLAFNARLPKFLSTNNPEPIEGVIEYVIPIRNPALAMLQDSVWVPVPKIDTIKFECWLIDRKSTESNHVTTPETIVVNR